MCTEICSKRAFLIVIQIQEIVGKCHVTPVEHQKKDELEVDVMNCIDSKYFYRSE